MKFTIAFLLLLSSQLMAQTSPLPVTEYKGTNPALPLVCYLTGDGGLNSFSKALIQQWNQKGYSVIALDCKDYFWKKKTPAQAATDVNSLLMQYLNAWKYSRFFFTGYSFGADVLPFIQNRLPVATSNKIVKTVMLSPSATTDFEVHFFYGSKGESVPAEINKLTKPGLVLFGEDEKDTPGQAIHNPGIIIQKLPGDHHYNNDAAAIVQLIASRL